MTEKRYICNTTSRREYYLPGGTFVCRIDYSYPFVHCTVRCIFKGDQETYDADKRHPHWQKHVQMFETLAWEKYKMIDEHNKRVQAAIKLSLNHHKARS